jgi:hypothetical protein
VEYGATRELTNQNSKPKFLGIAEPDIDKAFYKIEFGTKDFQLP